MTGQYRVLVVGVGSIGERHLRCFQKMDRCIMSFCEPNVELRATIADRYGINEAYEGLDAALTAGEYDVAVIATPAHLHVPIAVRLAELGIHLLIEKPLSLSMEGMDRLTEIVSEKSIAVAVGYTHRAHPANRGLKEEIDSGRLGKPLQITVSCGQHFPTHRPAYREIYFTRHETGGGAIQDAITHMYNLGEWLVGPINQLVTDAAHLHLSDVTVEDTVHTMARHDEVLGSYSLNLYQAPSEAMITVICENGTGRVDYEHSRWSWMGKPDTPWHHQPVDVPERDWLYVEQATAFLESVEGQGQPFCPLDEGIQTLRVNLASLKSVEERNWQQV